MKILKSLFSAILIVFFYGCSSQSSKESNSGVAAVVNGVEITQGEVEFLAKNSIASGTDKPEAIEQKKAILASLVKTELLAQKGRELNVDKDPEYAIALYEAQRQVLAGLAEARLAKTISPISSDQAKELVANNPRFFSDRKLLVYDEVMIQGVDVPFLNSLIAMVDNGASEEQLLEELSSKNKVFQKITRSLTSDQVQPGIADVLLKSKLNHPIVARVGDKFSMILMTRMAVPLPIQGEQAKRVMMSMAYSVQRNNLLAKSITDMVNSSKITYYGEYAKTSDHQGLAGLPNPDKKSEATKIASTIRIGAVLSVSFILGVWVLTASMRILRGELWLPRLWPSKAGAKERETAYEWAYEAYPLEKNYIAVVLLGILACFVYEIYLLVHYYPIPGIIVSIFSGVVLGIASSRVFTLDALKNASNKIYAVLIAIVTIPIIVGVIYIMRQSGI